MATVWRVWSEWDLGAYDKVVFATKEAAYQDLLDNENLSEVLEEDETLDDLIKKGLIGFHELSLEG